MNIALHHHGSLLLNQAMSRIAADIDAAFNDLLDIPTGPRARLVGAMRYAAIGGGKRLRPLLLMATAELYGAPRRAAIRAGAAIEAIHVYSLIHDDLPCMDDDTLRHGKPTVHLAYDEATAVLAGDALHDLAFEILADPFISDDPEVRIELVRTLGRASGHKGMAGGQMMDLVAETQEFDLETITHLQQLKTGALLAAAIEMGAILGRAPDDARAALQGFARDIGLAFQIADDLIDHEGDASLAGKSVGKDARAGKQTFVSLLGAEGARYQAASLIERAVAQLSHYGDKADLLRAIAYYIIKRDR